MCNCTGNTALDIVAQLANNTKLVTELKAIHVAEYTNDMMNDIWLYLLESVSNEKLSKLCKDNQIKFFLIKIITNQVYSKKSDTAVKYRNPFNYLRNTDRYVSPDVIRDIMGHVNEKDIDYTTFNKKVEEELAKLHFYDREIFIHVINSDKTYKELSKELKIADYNIGHTYRKVCEILRIKMKSYNFDA